jgi:predicted nuclease of predicted toxin-antitoxin system
VRLKLDENIGQRGVELLRAAGHDVATVFDEALQGVPDRGVLSACYLEGRCIVTLDLEFGNTLVLQPSTTRGIVVIRLPHKPTPDDLLSALRTLIEGLKKADVRGRLWIVQRDHIREHQPDDS